MKLFVHGFWSGFIDKTNPVHIAFFINLFEKVFDTNIELGCLEDSEILLESIFNNETFLYSKKWAYTFLFSGESRLNNFYKDYTCVLYGQKNHNNIINLPLFIPNIYCCNLMNKLTESTIITKVPNKNICAVISNPSGNERNLFLNYLEKKIKIDYGGSYKNNINRFEDTYISPNFINRVSEYKFIVSMENSREETYITEKILQGFLAGSIPVYWGSSRICDYFNKERFLQLNEINETFIIINKIEEIINDETKFLEIVNKPIFNNNKLERDINEIAKDIKNLIFNKKYNLITKIYAICSHEFEPDRHTRLSKLFTNLSINDYNIKFICPTYKHTITDETMNTHIKHNLVKRLRVKGMKKSEMSLILNYKAVLKNIIDNYSDGLFLIFESDIFVDYENIDKLNHFISFINNKKNDWDLIHIGKGGETDYFTKPYCDCVLPYRDRVTHLPETYIEDITNENDKYRLIRKFHTRCTDSFIWNFTGIKKFYEYITANVYYDAPLDYYLTNFLENNLDFKHYWSLDYFFIQGSNYGLIESTIQND